MAENVARKYNISREDQDKFALESHKKASAALKKAKAEEERAPEEGGTK